ncbi:MAG: hypothetical protein QXI12_07755 [Candidatus Methanomethyliaceae archaeon]
MAKPKKHIPPHYAKEVTFPMIDLTPYQTDHLLLLIGTNPLPNYVAALLLAKSNSTIHLLHTPGPEGTGKFAERLDALICSKLPDVRLVHHQTDECRGNRISEQVKELCHSVPKNASLGFHYTGGTKAMVLHSYRGIISSGFPNVRLSYLDARSLSLVVETDSTPLFFNASKAVNITIEEMLALHGYTANPPAMSPQIDPELYHVLAKTNYDRNSNGDWRKWLEETQCSVLPDAAQYPSLLEVRTVFDRICGGQATPELLARHLGCKNAQLASCAKWLKGEWLDHYVFWALNEVASDAGAGKVCLELKPRPHEFEIDVATVKGYQLFAVSCIVSNKKEKCKEHLLEVYVRACQIGGDEARVGLVSFYHDPAALRKEIDEAWFSEGRIKVFDPQDLLDPERFKESLKQWLISAA